MRGGWEKTTEEIIFQFICEVVAEENLEKLFHMGPKNHICSLGHILIMNLIWISLHLVSYFI